MTSNDKKMNEVDKLEKISDVRETIYNFAHEITNEEYITSLLNVIKTTFPKEEFRNIIEKIERIFINELSSLEDETISNFKSLLKVESNNYKSKEYKKLESEFKTLKLLVDNKCNEGKIINIDNELNIIISKLVRLKLVDVYNENGVCTYPLLHDIFEYKLLSGYKLLNGYKLQSSCIPNYKLITEIVLEWYSYVSDFPKWNCYKLSALIRNNLSEESSDLIIELYNNCHNLRLYIPYNIDRFKQLYEYIRDKDLNVYNRLKEDNSSKA